ncbi:ATP-binding protein [Pseudomonas fragi]|uniref:ATP-binding protein n=1 Tax=Pseudomonas fragi TaxID=296 RepID=UPI0021C1CAB4|nr:ATP-binding protein [Pseudomonas fragi]UXL37072.1 ATP-binding protein [Pseudomonas fragi]
MKIKNFFLPFETTFSTPKAVRRLLRLFAWLLLFSMISGVCFYLNSCFNDELSKRRREMSRAIYDAQIYFHKREAMLVHMNRSLMYRANDSKHSAMALVGQLEKYKYTNIALGELGGDWSILLSGRDLADLDNLEVGLLYVAADKALTVSYLHGRFDRHYAIPSSILEQLKNIGFEDSPEIIWLADANDPLSRIYLFSKIDHDGGWLGIKLNGADVKEAIGSRDVSGYLLLDSDFRSASGGSIGFNLEQEAKEVGFLKDEVFGLSGTGFLPEYLRLVRAIEGSNWALVYFVTLSDLLSPLWGVIIGGVLVCLVSSCVVWLLVRRINLRLVIPAQRHFEQLIESEQFFRAIIETAPVALCVLRRTDGTVVLENRLASQWLGDGVNRKRWSKSWIEQAFCTHESGRYEEVETVGGGHLYLSFVPTRYSGEDVVFCAFSNISMRKQIEETLAKAKELADSANEAKTIFLATMSHEIRTPLYGVLGTLELLGRTDMTSQQQAYFLAIQRSSSVLQQLINDVLDVSKIEAGQLILQVEEFNPVELVEDVVHAYAAAAWSKKLHLYACCDPQLPTVLRGDAARIRQVLNNLLSNAVKYTDHGHIVIRVRVESRDAERISILWQVADTGVGIAKEDHRRLFDPFYQTGSRAYLPGGTGLGLSICQRLTQLMNGDIHVVSELGLGSSFMLTLALEVELNTNEALLGLPLLPPQPIFVYSPVRELAASMCGWLNKWGALAQVGLASDSKNYEGLVQLELRPYNDESTIDWDGSHVVAYADGYSNPQFIGGKWRVSMHSLYAIYQAIKLSMGKAVERHDTIERENKGEQLNLRVLVAEDNPINQLVLKDQLEAIGCSVVITSDGNEALSQWVGGEFDIILSDINMPGMDGYELARELRQAGCIVPIIGATANAALEESDRCLSAGMNLCLVKPVNLSVLYSTLNSLK